MASGRGLKNFISEIRGCASKDDERDRVYKEMANIRKNFTQKQKLSSYSNVKYVWKMCYIWMLGYEIDFGHMQVINLISGLKFTEKTVGYLAMTLLIHQNDDLMKLIVNGVRNDLTKGDINTQALALSCIANTGFPQLAEVVRPVVYKLLVGTTTPAELRKKAAICLNRMIKSMPGIAFPEEWTPAIVGLLEHRSLGVVIAVSSLLLGMLKSGVAEIPETVTERVVLLLQKFVLLGSCPQEYVYKKTPCPWLQVKLLQILQHFPFPQKGTVQARLLEVLSRIFSRTPETNTKCTNKKNTDHSILFESINLLTHYGPGIADERLKLKASTLLGRFIQMRDGNMRYLGLSMMARMAAVEESNGDVLRQLRKHQATILYGLKDPDISIRKRALNLLFLMCDKSNSLVVVKELLGHLAEADISIREEMVLKIAILAERYAPNPKWYVDTILHIIKNTGDFTDDDIWHRACQIVSMKRDLHGYAAREVYTAIQEPQINEMLLRAAGYILGEYGDSLEDEGPDGPPVLAEAQYAALFKHWETANNRTKAILMGAFLKLGSVSDSVDKEVRALLEKLKGSLDLDIQQRAIEYSVLLDGSVVDEDGLGALVAKMPAFKENKENPLIPSRPRTASSVRAAAAAAAKKEEEEEEEEAESPPLLEVDDSTVTNGRIDTPRSGAVTTFKPSEATQMRQWFVGLVSCSKARGLLYENAAVQVGVGVNFAGNQGRIQLFYGNKGSANMTNFKVVFNQIGELKWKVEPIKSDLAPKEQLRQRVQVICMKPFKQSPRVTVSFNCNGAKHSYALVLPVAVTSFVVGKPIAPQQFSEHWASLSQPGQTEQQSFAAKAGSSMATAKALLTSSDKVGFAQVSGMDKDGKTLTCAGLFETGSTGPQGAALKVGCMMRVETNAEATHFRVTVRTIAPTLSKAILTLVTNLLR